MMRRVSRRQKRSIAKFKTLVPSVDDAFEMGLSSPISMFYAFDNEPSRILFRDTKKIPKFIQDHDCYPEYIEALDAYKKGIEEGLRDRGDRDLFLRLPRSIRNLIHIRTGQEMKNLNMWRYGRSFYMLAPQAFGMGYHPRWWCDADEFCKLISWCFENITSPWTIHRGYFYFSDRNDHVLFRLAM